MIPIGVIASQEFYVARPTTNCYPMYAVSNATLYVYPNTAGGIGKGPITYKGQSAYANAQSATSPVTVPLTNGASGLNSWGYKAITGWMTVNGINSPLQLAAGVYRYPPLYNSSYGPGYNTYEDANYVYLVCTANCTVSNDFYASVATDIFVVAGGGGTYGYSDNRGGGGAGAGGVVMYTNVTMPYGASSGSVYIGAGSAASSFDNGGDSAVIVSGVTNNAKGGGFGGYGLGAGWYTSAENGHNGGSGGGGGWFSDYYWGNSRAYPGGIAAYGTQGKNGATASLFTYGGGGGGAGAAATNANGGAGTSAYSTMGQVTGTGQNVSGTYYYAGGGAGNPNASPGNASGGAGGGGSVTGWVGTSGLANTGGGAAAGNSGSNGGSGIVIFRTAKSGLP